VHFATPMSEGFAADAVRLLDAATREVLPDVLLPMQPELWDRARTRLTLLLDPGRIKRGLASHLDAGYPLTRNRDVCLQVDPSFLDATGRPLDGGFERAYHVGEDVRQHIDPGQWQIEPPPAHSTSPLTVRFDRPLDSALALRCVTVSDAAGRKLHGQVWLDRGEQVWRFSPTDPWAAAGYLISVDPVLEDLAGNSLSRVFDRDLTLASDAPRGATTRQLSFRCR
jgi:hypothetical protein